MFDLDKYSGKTALVADDGSSLGYSDLASLSSSFSSSISSSRGLLFCLCRNTLPSVLGYVSSIVSGIPVVLVSADLDEERMDHLIDTYIPDYIWSPDDKTFSNSSAILFKYHNYSLFQRRQSHPQPLPAKKLAVCLPTSGSTGSPKFVRLTENNLRSNAESIISYLGLTSDERPILFLPMHYSYGLSILNSHLMVGATILLTDKSVFQKEIWNFIKEQKATSFSGVPYTYEMLVRFRILKTELPYIKTFTQAGGKLSDKTVSIMAEYAQKTGKRFFVMYGQTEASPRISYLPPEMAESKSGSIGIPVPGGRISIMDENGLQIEETGEKGELVYHGPNVCMGYAECRRDLTLGDENNSCLHTGDIAYKDADGYYYIVGRKSRFVKVWGNRCNIDEIEELAKSIVSDCACVGNDNLITIFITEPHKSQDLLSFLNKKTGLNTAAFRIKLIPTIPRNASGKIQYNQLQTS